MANTVQIELQVDAQGAVQGVRTFDTAIKGGTGSVKQLGVELQSAGAKATAAATQIAGAANSVDAFMQRAKAATAAYNAQAARGIEVQKQLGAAFDAAMVQGKTFVEAQEAATAAVAAYVPVAQAAAKVNYSMAESMGVARIAAAGAMGSFGGMASGLARVAASSKLLGPIFDAIMPVAVGLAIVGILVDMGEKVYNIYEKYLSLDAAAERFNKTLDAQRSKDFMDVHSIEEAQAAIEAANDSAQELENTVSNISKLNKKTRWTDLVDITGISELSSHLTNQREAVIAEDQANAHRLQAIEAQKKQLTLQHQINDAQIDAAHAGDSALRGQARIDAQRQHRLQKLEEEQRYTSEQSGDPAAGRAIERVGIRGADADADAETFNLNRQQTQALMRLRNEATDAALRGSALYAAQESQAIEELKFKDMDSAAARDAIHEKFHNMQMRRLEDEQAAVAKRTREADGAGLTGVAKAQYEGQTRDQDILSNVREGKYSSLEDAQQDRISNQRQTLGEMAAAERSFTDDVDQLADSTATHQISGFARINANAQKQLDELQRKFDEVYGHIDRTAPGGEAAYQQGVAGLNRGKSYIQAGSADQTAEMAKRNANETAAIEAQANAKSLSAEKQKSAAIQAEYEGRLQKYQEELAQQEISQNDFNRRVAAAAEERDAEMVEAAKQAHDKMAHEFTGFFEGMDHPLKYLAKEGDKAAGNAAASLVQRAQGKGAADQKGVGGFLDSIFPSFPNKKSGDAAAEMPGRTHAAAATSSVFSVGTAQIRVGTAQISFGGSGASEGSGGAGTVLGSVSAPDAAATFSHNGAPGARGANGAAGAAGAAGTAGADGSEGTEVNLPAQTYAAFNRPPGGGMSRGAPRVSSSGGYGGVGAPSARSGASFEAPAMMPASVAPATVGGMATAAASVPSSPGASAVGSSSGASVLPAQTSSALAASGFGGGATVGGAGDANSPGAPARSAVGAVPAKGGGITGAISDAQSAVDFTKQAKSIFGKSGSAKNTGPTTMDETTSNLNNYKIGSDGTEQKTGFGSFLSDNSAQIESGVQGGLGVFSAYEGNGGIGGALKGGMSGMQLGLALGGPIGAGIGAGAGAVIGAIGFGGREKARVYDLKQVRPRITSDTDAYEQGGMDYLNAYSDMQSLMNEAKQTVSKMGPAANSYYQDTIKKEIETAEQKFTTMQRAGRSQYTASTASYDVGTDFVPSTGMAMIHQGERIVPSDQNRQITQALNVHNSYRTTMQSPGARPAGGNRTMNMNVHAIDSKGVALFLDKYKHSIRGAVNDSYAENSGGSSLA